jgi:hypothetical protein
LFGIHIRGFQRLSKDDSDDNHDCDDSDTLVRGYVTEIGAYYLNYVELKFYKSKKYVNRS